MATDTHLTIRDYFDRLFAERQGNGRHLSGTKRISPDNRLFDQLLTSRLSQNAKSQNLESKGLTIADYLANPVRGTFRKRNHLKEATSEKKLVQKPAESVAPAAMHPPDHKACSTPKKQAQVKLASQTQTSSETGKTREYEQQKIENSISKAARKYDLPVELIKGVIKAESNFNVNALSHAGAQGLMQLMPGTAEELGVNNPFDIEQNIDGGARYLRKMLDRFGGDVKVALAAYNAGPGAVKKYGGQIPPYQETERYINRVMRFSKQVA
ncbi:MAG: lytic transglycosylase domain-containing protein [Desulfobacterales bacterium]|jgi:soluble lytic murein transglycosylase-like protein